MSVSRKCNIKYFLSQPINKFHSEAREKGLLTANKNIFFCKANVDYEISHKKKIIQYISTIYPRGKTMQSQLHKYSVLEPNQ